MISFSANQYNAFISPHVKMCTQLKNEITVHVPKNYSTTTFVVPRGKDYTCQFSYKALFL